MYFLSYLFQIGELSCKIRQYLCRHNWLHHRDDAVMGTVYRCDKCGAFKSFGKDKMGDK